VAVWIKIEDVSVKPWTSSLVYTQAEATQLSLADAREAVKAVQTHYVNHLWAPARISGDTYIVVGQEKARLAWWVALSTRINGRGAKGPETLPPTS
jgi:hypothetical protein